MKHCLVDFCKVCSDGGPEVDNGPAAGVLGSEIKYTRKSSPPVLQNSGAKNLICSIVQWSLNKCVQIVSRSKMAPPKRVLGLNHRKT